MKVYPITTRIFQEGENIIEFIMEHVPKLKQGSILAVTSKIVALSERRTATAPDKKAKDKIIQKESKIAIATKYVWLTLKDGMAMASAGIDESNANGKLILLPKDSYKAAKYIRAKLKQKFELKRIGILITDSRTAPFRAGITGAALGYAGFCGIKDYRKEKDIFGRPFKYTQVNVADSLATAAVFEMGEGNERQPLVIIENAKVKFRDSVNKKELFIPFEEDMYRPLFPALTKK